MIETILLPADFSTVTTNAAHYALALAKQLGTKRIIVYHSYEIQSVTDPLNGYETATIVSPYRKESEEKLNNLVNSMKPLVEGIEIDAYHSHSSLTEAVQGLAKKTGTQLVVMGTEGGGSIKETFIPSNSVSVARNIDTPVIIVPAHVSFKRIEKILLLSDLQDVEETTPIDTIKKIVDVTGASLSVLNITDHADKAAASAGKTTLEQQLTEYNPSFHFAPSGNFTASVEKFVVDNSVDLVIVVPKKHGFFNTVFGTDHTKSLAFHSKVPLLATHK